jgi:hypothetical protein
MAPQIRRSATSPEATAALAADGELTKPRVSFRCHASNNGPGCSIRPEPHCQYRTASSQPRFHSAASATEELDAGRS